MCAKRLQKTKKDLLFWVVLAALIGTFCYCAYRLGSYYLADRRSREMAESVSKYVHVPQTPGLDRESEREQIQVDFPALRQVNGDIVAWLYGPGTEISYPVVQGKDNDQYLYLLPDRTWNVSGSLFLDYRCSPGFSDNISIIYGHHMKTGAMFGGLVQYKEQSYYKAHPYFYLITPEQKYRVELFAGCVIPSDAELYQSSVPQEYLQDCINNSTFIAPVESVPEGPILVLSTCTYEYENARYAVLGELVSLE
ncbi:MAG: class B sortase [Oscillospiraceae bacterium]|nr:class B sortase [Oscillospiraceae bacterium]